jgi:hypothetical protein
MTDLTWRKSSFSGSEANCVEVAASDRVLVRDTKNNSGAVLRFTPAAWRKFADQVKRSLSSDPSRFRQHPANSQWQRLSLQFRGRRILGCP